MSRRIDVTPSDDQQPTETFGAIPDAPLDPQTLTMSAFPEDWFRPTFAAETAPAEPVERTQRASHRRSRPTLNGRFIAAGVTIAATCALAAVALVHSPGGTAREPVSSPTAEPSVPHLAVSVPPHTGRSTYRPLVRRRIAPAVPVPTPTRSSEKPETSASATPKPSVSVSPTPSHTTTPTPTPTPKPTVTPPAATPGTSGVTYRTSSEETPC